MSRNRSSGKAAPLWASQNFLTSRVVIERLLAKTTIGPLDHVVEIGPGKGHSTAGLIERSGKVSAVELDGRLFEALRTKFAGIEKLRLYRGDFMSWQLPAAGAYKVFANIPFSCTTAIIKKLAGCTNPPREAWLTMEKGAAKRFMGSPRETLGSLMLKPVFELRIVYHFRREDFHPAPGVDVVLLHLKRKTPPDITRGQMRAYERFLSCGLGAGCAGLRRILSAKQLTYALREANVPRDFTPDEVLYTQWLCLFRCFARVTKL